jgi:hypothetical protein
MDVPIGPRRARQERLDKYTKKDYLKLNFMCGLHSTDQKKHNL